MTPVYKPPFAKFIKKQHKLLQATIYENVIDILNNPDLGKTKIGDLYGVRSHKFKYQTQQYLIAYQISGETVVFYMVATHENFYRDLKKYFRETK